MPETNVGTGAAPSVTGRQSTTRKDELDNLLIDLKEESDDIYEAGNVNMGSPRAGLNRNDLAHLKNVREKGNDSTRAIIGSQSKLPAIPSSLPQINKAPKRNAFKQEPLFEGSQGQGNSSLEGLINDLEGVSGVDYGQTPSPYIEKFMNVHHKPIPSSVAQQHMPF